jgi:hypothetical protein
MQGFEFEARAVRAACERDPALGYELCQRFTAAVVRRLHTTRSRLLEAHAQPGLRALIPPRFAFGRPTPGPKSGGPAAHPLDAGPDLVACRFGQ